MTQNLTRRDLLDLHIQNTQLPTILKVYLNGKIKEFYNLNKIRLDGINSGLTAIYKSHVEFENDHIKLNEEKKHTLLEGKPAEDFQKAQEDYLSVVIAADL